MATATCWLMLSALSGLHLGVSNAPRAVMARRTLPRMGTSYTPLESSQAYEKMLAEAEEDSISIVKFTAPWCRTCIATASKLDKVAKDYPSANFYSLDCGVRLKLYFKTLGITQLPYVRVYVGKRMVHELVVASLKKDLPIFRGVVHEAWLRRRERKNRKERRRVLLALRANQIEQRALRRGAAENSLRYAELQAEAAKLEERRSLMRLVAQGVACILDEPLDDSQAAEAEGVGNRGGS